MSRDATHPLDDLAVYALDALDDAERSLVDAHLTHCVACQAELDQHRTTLAQLTTPDEPPPELWDRIARQTAVLPRGGGQAGPGAQVVPIETARDPRRRGKSPGGPWEPRHRKSRRPTGSSRWVAAVAAAAVVVAGVTGVAVLSRQGDDAPATLAELAAAAVEDPDATIVTLSSTTDGSQAVGQVVTTGDPTGYVVFDGLPRLPADRSYQLWKVDDPNVPISLGVLGDGSTAAAAVSIPEGTSAFAITNEPRGGVPTPTGLPVAQGTT